MSAEKALTSDQVGAESQLEDNREGQNGDGKRERSTIEFPYQDLDDAVAVAKGVQAVGGSSCQREQLAAQLQQTATGGGFGLRLLTAKTFGLLTYDRGTVTLTPLGTRIYDPQQEKAARAEAFLTVPLYKAVYEKFRLGTLPPNTGLEAEMVSLGVSQKQKDKARQVFQRSAKEAGFFGFGTDRLVMPTIKGSTEVAAEKPKEKPKGIEDEGKRDHDDDGKRDPIIEGLIKRLPEPGAEWSIEARKKWLQAASNIFELIYTDSEEGGALKIEIQKDSAK